MTFRNAEGGEAFYLPEEAWETLEVARDAAVEFLAPFVIGPALIIGGVAEQGARFLSKGRGKLTTAFLALGIVLGACSPTPTVSEKPSSLPDGGGKPAEIATTIPLAEATATAKVEPNPMNITEFGAYVRPDVSDELTRLLAVRETTTEQSLIKQLDEKIKEYQLAVDVENGLMSRVSALPGAETATFANTQLFDLAYKDGNGAQAKIVTAFEMAKQTSKSGNENLAILSWGGKSIDSWLFSETKDDSTNVFFVDKETGKQVVIMQTIKDKPGYMKVFLADGNELTVQMSLEVSKGGGSKMAAMINKSMLLDLDQVDGQWVTDMNGDKYALDLSKHDWLMESKPNAAPTPPVAERLRFTPDFDNIPEVPAMSPAEFHKMVMAEVAKMPPIDATGMIPVEGFELTEIKGNNGGAGFVLSDVRYDDKGKSMDIVVDDIAKYPIGRTVMALMDDPSMPNGKALIFGWGQIVEFVNNNGRTVRPEIWQYARTDGRFPTPGNGVPDVRNVMRETMFTHELDAKLKNFAPEQLVDRSSFTADCFGARSAVNLTKTEYDTLVAMGKKVDGVKIDSQEAFDQVQVDLLSGGFGAISCVQIDVQPKK